MTVPDTEIEPARLDAATPERDERLGPTQRRVARLRAASGAAGLLAVGVGLAVLAGWAFDVPRLTQGAPGLVSMKLNTAACLCALGLGVWLLSRPSLGERASRTVVVLAAVVALVGAATLLEYASGYDLGIDDPLGLDRAAAVETSAPGRMSPMTGLLVIGLAGALLALRGGRVRAAQSAAWASLAVSAAAVIGYLFGIERLYRVDVYTSMAVHTAAMLALLSVAVLGLRAGSGPVGLVTADTAGGVVVRRLLPWALLLPTTLGGLLVVGLSRDWYGERLALAVLVSLMTVAGVVVVWVQGRGLSDVDLRRAGAEEAMRRLEESLAERERLTQRLTSSERHARGVVANSADAYIAVSNQGRVQDWNDSAATLFGWTREEATGRTLDTLMIPEELASAHRAGLRRAAQTGTGPLLGRPVEVEAVHREGHRLRIELTIWAVRDREGLGFHAFLRDVTARTVAQDELRRANDDLRQFAGVVAHDLRSPLATVLGFAQLLEDHTDASDDLAHAWITRITAAAQRGEDLINDLLRFAQVGQSDLITTRVDLTALVTEVVEEQAALAAAPTACEVASLPTVEGDVGLLRQLFANLVGNALKYAASTGRPVLRVDAAPQPRPGRIVVRVSDNGPGIAEDDRARIFDMFQRGSDVGSVAGTGVGLAISRRVVERHHGRIWVEDAELGGAAFCIELPAASAPGGERI